MKGKNTRIELRITKKLKQEIKETAKSLNTSASRLTVDAIYSYLLKTENFAICDCCQSKLIDLEQLTLMGKLTVECKKCKKTLVWDTEKESFI